MRTEHMLRREVVEISKLLWSRGWVANHDGNVSAKAAPGRIIATPTAMSKRLVDADKLIIVNEQAKVVHGRFRVFSEINLHIEIYNARTDVGAVVHAHPPHATAYALTGKELPCFLAEAVVSLGARIPVTPFAMPGTASGAALRPFVADEDVVLLGRHGVLAWGVDPEQAFLRLELVEHLAGILAKSTTVPAPFTEEELKTLLDARTKAGLGTAGRASAKNKR